jgi:hypothetical protein
VYDFSAMSDTGPAAVWASSALTNATGQMLVNSALLTRLADGDDLILGEALRAAKEATSDLDVRGSWVPFGGPAMRLR